MTRQRVTICKLLCSLFRKIITDFVTALKLQAGRGYTTAVTIRGATLERFHACTGRHGCRQRYHNSEKEETHCLCEVPRCSI